MQQMNSADSTLLSFGNSHYSIWQPRRLSPVTTTQYLGLIVQNLVVSDLQPTLYSVYIAYSI